MEEKPKTAAMNGLTYGVITAVVMIIYSLILFLLDLHLNQTLGFIGIIFIIAGMIWGALEYRNKVLGGFMTYGKAFSATFWIAFFALLISAIYTFIFFQFISPGTINDLYELSRQRILDRTPNLTDEQLDQAMNWTAMFLKPWSIALMNFIQTLIICVIISLIISIFVKKEDKSLTSAI